MTQEQARHAVTLVLEDISDRKGIGDEWDQIDPDTQREIKHHWAGLIWLAANQ